MSKINHTPGLHFCFPACKGEACIQHGLHFLNISASLGLLLIIVDKFSSQAKPGEDGAQVVRNSGEHQGPVIHHALDTFLHIVEGTRGSFDFSGPGDRQWFRVDVAANALGRLRKDPQRPRQPVGKPENSADDKNPEDDGAESRPLIAEKIKGTKRETVDNPAAIFQLNRKSERAVPVPAALQGNLKASIRKFVQSLAYLFFHVCVLPPLIPGNYRLVIQLDL